MTHHLRHRVIVEEDVLVRAARRERLLARSPQARMLIPERFPARITQRAGGLVLVVGHERVELLDVLDDVADRPAGKQLAAIGAAARAARLDVAEELKRQQPQVLAVLTQARLVDPALRDELAEDRQGAKAREHRRPAQHSGLKGGLELPLQCLAQPRLLDHQQVKPGARRGRLVLAQWDPRVKPWAPGVVLPPLARVISDHQMPVAAPKRPGPELRPTELAGAPRALADERVLPIRDGAVDERAQRWTAGHAGLLGQPDEPPDQQRVGRGDRQPGVDHPPQAIREVALHRLRQRSQIKAAPLPPALQPPAKRRVIGQRARRELRQAQLRGHLLEDRQVALRRVEAAAVQRRHQRGARDPAHCVLHAAVICCHCATVRCSASSDTQP